MTEVVSQQEMRDAFAMFYGMAMSLKDIAPPPEQLTDQERVSRAKAVYLKALDNGFATQLDACVHCGACAQACQYYIGTEDPKYTPIHKLDLMKRVYQRELSPLSWLLRPFVRDITVDDLHEERHLAFEACTMCGRCNMVCPAGINIADMVAVNRSALAQAGLMPDELRFMVAEQQAEGTIFGADKDLFEFRIGVLEEKLGFKIPVDKEKADVMLVTSGLDIHLFSDATGGAVETLQHMGVDYTLLSDAYEGANFGALGGDDALKKKLTKKLTEAAIRIGAKTVIVPECGHSFPALRWGAAESVGHEVPFDVSTVSEYFGKAVIDGRLKLQARDHPGIVALHDPCKVGRWGGVFDEPREILKACGYHLKETESSRELNFCCGGGAGNFLIQDADQLKRVGYRIKMGEIEATGAERLMVSCGSCRMNFEVGKVKAGDSMPVESLAAVIAAHLPAKEGVNQ